MNYRHAFHAGNFADVLKHIVLVRILVHLRQKATPFRIIDTHAGAGAYDLSGEEAERTGEWRDGIGRVLAQRFEPAVESLLAPYLGLVERWRAGPEIASYPGSPLLAQALLRDHDRLIACELEPSAAALLRIQLGRDRRTRALQLDGWTALSAFVPPKERRGLVLVDPPFERTDEFQRLAAALIAAHRKWSTGIYTAWYPAKEKASVEAFHIALTQAGLGTAIGIELAVGPTGPDRLGRCGLVVINPPWTLVDQLALVLPPLAATLGRGEGAGFRLGALSTWC